MVDADREVLLHDLTLRDPRADDGTRLPVADRLGVLEALDDLGIAVVEVGAPRGGDDLAFLRRALAVPLTSAALAVAGRVAGPGEPADGVTDLLAAGTELVVLRVDTRVCPCAPGAAHPAQTVAAIRSAVACLVGEGRRVVLDAEHYPAGFDADPVCAVDLLGVALTAGAEAVVLVDSDGRTPPDRIVELVEATADVVGPGLGIGARDVGGCAVANGLLAVDAGARRLQVASRPGFADLAVTVTDLAATPGVTLRPVPDLSRLALLGARIATHLGVPALRVDAGAVPA